MALRKIFCTSLLIILFITSCTKKSQPPPDNNQPSETYSIGGTAAGLSGSPLILQNNNADDLSLTNNGTFNFPTQIKNGATYNVTIKTQPNNVICNVTNGSGTINGAPIENISIACGTSVTPIYPIGVTVSGLVGTLVLDNNGTDDLHLSDNGPATFSHQLNVGSTYNVTVKTQPNNQTCGVVNGTGTVSDSPININIKCDTNPIPTYSIGGTLSGISSGTLILQNNNIDDLPLTKNGTFNFNTQLKAGTQYNVTIKTQPENQNCTVNNATGTVEKNNITNIEVLCVLIPTYSIGGTLSGISSGTLILQNNNIDDLPLTKNGTFNFNTQLRSDTQYNVTIKTQPDNQNCTVNNATGTVEKSNITNIDVTCKQNPTYAINVNVIGLNGTLPDSNPLNLQNNNTDQLKITKNGQYTFPTRLYTSNNYNITVTQNPPNQYCRIANASGTVQQGDVSVKITCVTRKKYQNNTTQIHFTTSTTSNSCIDVDLNNNNKLAIWNCTTDRLQMWDLLQNGQIKLSSKTSNVCLAVPDGEVTDQTTLQVSPCDTTKTNQLWSYYNSSHAFKLATTNKCFELLGGNTTNGTSINIRDCQNNAPNQMWSINNMSPSTQLVNWYKPTYHIAEQTGANPFDPNGAIYYGDTYHLMHIYQDAQGGSQYAHLTSTDLFNWTKQPDPFTDGVNFSGNAFLDANGNPIIIYLSTASWLDSIAFSDPKNLNKAWVKTDGYNPFQTNNNEYRSDGDPFGWYQTTGQDSFNEKTYYAIVGGTKDALNHDRPTLITTKDDLKSWQVVHPFFSDAAKWRDGRDMSCPKLFKLGDKYVFMFISHNTGAQFVVGTIADQVFMPTLHRKMNWPGGTFFAPETLLDNKGRRIMWAWVMEPRWDLTGQMGTLSLPRVFTMENDAQVHINPPDEIKNLRSNPQTISDTTISNQEQPITLFNGDTIEIDLTIDLTNTNNAGIKILQSDDKQEETVISYDKSSGTLNLDLSKSTLDPNVHYGWGDNDWIGNNIKPQYPSTPVQSADLALGADQKLNLRIFIDRSIVEVFANGIEVITGRVYPTLDSSINVSLFSKEGSATFTNIQSWDLALNKQVKKQKKRTIKKYALTH